MYPFSYFNLEFEEDCFATYAFSNTNSVYYDQNCWFYLTYLGEESSSIENVALEMLELKNMYRLHMIY